MRLFDIGDEFRSLNEMLDNDCEFDPITGEVTDNTELLKSMFNDLTVTFGDKLDGCAYIINELEMESLTLQNESKRLIKRSKRIDTNIDTLKGMMLSVLLELPEAKLKTVKFNYSTRKSESVMIEEGFNYKSEYVRVKEVREPDKTAIKEAIKAGECIIGAELVTNTTLTIK